MIQELTVERAFKFAPPMRFVFEALTGEIDRWWCHRIRPSAEVVLEPHEGGHFFQVLEDQRRVLGMVKKVKFPSFIEIVGGPEVAGAKSKLLKFKLEPDGYGTKLTVIHSVSAKGPVDARQIRHGWGELLGACLREWLDHREPVSPIFEPKFGMSSH